MERYLDRCIKSLLSQTYERIEIILINDGSRDRSSEICLKYKKIDSRIIFLDKVNEGVSIARNTGMNKANGKYICFVDPDDYVDEKYIEHLFGIMLKQESDIVSCCALIDLGDTKVKNSFYKNGNNFNFVEIPKKRLYAQLLDNSHYEDADIYIDIGVPWGKLYNLEFLKRNQLEFNPSLRRMQDNIFNIYAFEKADKIVYIDEPLYIYNYENIPSVFSKYVKDGRCLFFNLINEIDIAGRKFGWRNKDILFELMNKRKLNLLLAMLFQNIMHKENGLSLRQQASAIKEIMSTKPCQFIFENVNLNEFKIHNKVILDNLKKERYMNVAIIGNWISKIKLLRSYF